LNEAKSAAVGAKKKNGEHQIYERMMARWTRNVGWFTGLLVVVGVVTACIFWRQLNVMQGQLDTTQSEERAWVYAPNSFVIGDDVIDDKNGMQLVLVGDLENVGHSPAQHVFVSFDIYLGPTPFPLRPLVDKACAKGERAPYNLIGTTIFPGEHHQGGVGETLNLSDIKKLKMMHKDKLDWFLK
jgi:hypothetical protein